MVVQALALQASLAPTARSGVVLGLFWSAALGLATVAIGDSYLPQYAPAAALSVHLVAAQSAFLCVIAAILLQSWRLRADPHWRPQAPAADLAGQRRLRGTVHACRAAAGTAWPGPEERDRLDRRLAGMDGPAPGTRPAAFTLTPNA